MTSINIDKNFEREKNIKALILTLLICAIIFFLFFLVTWSLPTIPPTLVNEGIEVNLGNSETGLGNVEPQAPGEPAQEQNSNPAPATQQNTTNDNVDDKGDEVINSTPTKAVVPVVKPVAPIIKAPVKPVINPTPKPPTPKAVFAGGTKNNSGGNNSDTYNGIKNQGIAGGNGNQGVPNGNPNSNTYGPGGGNGGIKIKSGLTGRKIAVMPKFEDDFNENSKVAVDIMVDATGKVTSAIVNPKGTTTTNTTNRQIAIKKAYQIKFNSGAEEQNGTIVFDLKVN
ncbi:MAG: hypothetical protein ACOVO1_11040 [Chitinophagaceae bacterium]